MTNCTQKDIRAIVGQINGRYRHFTRVWLDGEMKIKKSEKIFRERFYSKAKIFGKNFSTKNRETTA